MQDREVKRLGFLRDKFVSDLKDGHKTFVYKGARPLLFEEVLPLFIALNAHGDNDLLWVIPAGAPTSLGPSKSCFQDCSGDISIGYLRYTHLENFRV